MYQTMDIVYDMSESQLNELLLCMPVCTPWKMFYLIISRLVLDKSVFLAAYSWIRQYSWLHTLGYVSILGCILLDKIVFLAVYTWIRQYSWLYTLG